MEQYRKAYYELDAAIAEIENVMWLTNEKKLVRIVEKLNDVKIELLVLAAESCRVKVVE